MITVKDIEQELFSWAPYGMKEDFDNVGLLAGQESAPVRCVLTALDVTGWVVQEAKERGCELIVSHHPITFGLKSVTDRDPTGRLLQQLLRDGISAVCMHTNLDSAVGGVNDVLLALLGAEPEGILEPLHDELWGDYGIGRTGTLPEPLDMPDFLALVKEALGANGLRYHDAGKPVRRLAVCGGSGGSYLEQALALGCDTLLTADVKYDRFLTAKECGLNLIDGGHYSTEAPVIPVLTEHLRRVFPELEVLVSETHGQTEQFYI